MAKSSLADRLPRLELPGEAALHCVDVEDGRLVVTYIYSSGLEVTFWVEDDRMRWKANRPGRTRDDGVIVFDD